MSDNPAAAAAQELKKWLELLEKMLSKMESDKLGAAKAKLDSDRFDSMLKELKGIKEGIDKLPDGPDKDALLNDVQDAKTELNAHGGKTGHEMGKEQDFDGKFKNPVDTKGEGLGTGLKADAAAVAAPPPSIPLKLG